MTASTAPEDESLASSSRARERVGVNEVRMEATTMTTARAIFSKHRSRLRYYDTIDTTDDGHPVDMIVQRWIAHAPEQRRVVELQGRILAVLTAEARRAFLELEELRNEVAAEREEAYFDVGVRYGIDRERQRRRLRCRASKVAIHGARLDHATEREGIAEGGGPAGLVAVIAEWCVSLVERRADERKTRRRRGARAGST